MSPDRPQLRDLDRIILSRPDGDFVVLHDPLGVASPIAVDVDFLPVLDLLNGERSLPQVRQTLLMRASGLDVALEELDAFVQDLADACLLDDDIFRRRWGEMHKAFMAAPVLAPQVADLLYPADDHEFEKLFGDPGGKARTSAESRVRALWLPCEPLSLTAPLVDPLLRDLPRGKDLDLIVLLGADTQRGMLPFATTAKGHNTAFGKLVADVALVEDLERSVDWIRREEIRHRRNDGIELAANLVKWIYDSSCPPILSIACGPASLDDKDEQVEAFFDALELALIRKRVLFVACSSLSHCGPAYGEDTYDAEGHRDDDAYCLDAFIRRRPGPFLRRVLASPKQRARGAAPAYALARLIEPDDEVELDFYQVLTAPNAPSPDGTPGLEAGGIGCAGLRVLRG